MSKEPKFYICKHCGNIIGMIQDSGVTPVCCGEEMQELVANTVDASVEKHVPVIKTEGCKVTVTVGSTLHPMMPAHYIMWIYLHTQKGVQLKYLIPDSEPKAEFCLADDDKVIAAYEYCNLHGLWKGVE